MSSMSDSSTQQTATASPATKWSGLGYQQVPGLANRIIARYLRGQRRNMERFFQERGLVDSAERMRQIRLSRQGMLAKNRMFQEVLSDYAQAAMGTAAQPAATEAAPVADDGSVAVRDEVPADGTSGSGRDDGAGVSQVATDDSSEPVIEE